MTSIEKVVRQVAPRADARFLAASKDATAIMAKHGVKSQAAQAHLIAHMAHETQGFRKFEENLSYTAARLVQVWPTRFRTIEAAQPFARNPRALANQVGNGRMGNAIGSDDGWIYRGSGGLQHTGRAEFDRVTRRTGVNVIAKPAVLRDPASALLMWDAACTYFVDRGVLRHAERNDLTATTRAVNGGVIGLADRRELLARAEAALAGGTLVVTTKTTAERSGDAKRRAGQAVGGATVGSPSAGGGAKSAGIETGAAVLIGLGVALALGLVAYAFWRRFRKANDQVETMQLEALARRVDNSGQQP